MISYLAPALSQFADEELILEVGEVLDPGLVARFEGQNGLRLWVTGVAGEAAADEAFRRFRILVGAVRAWKPEACEYVSEREAIFGTGPARDSDGNQTIHVGTARMYLRTPGDLQSHTEAISNALTRHVRLRDALAVYGKENRDAADYFNMGELCAADLGRKSIAILDVAKTLRIALDELQDFAGRVIRAWMALPTTPAGESMVSDASEGPKPIHLKPGRTVRAVIIDDTGVTDTVSDTFYPRLSQQWFADVQEEMGPEPVRDSRRRQVVAAATFADSYLYEWVRDEVLGGRSDRWERLFEFFPEGDRDGVKERWKRVPKALKEAGLIPAQLNLGGTTWQEFIRLVDYRDGLVHGKASRPDGTHFPKGQEPVPSMNQLEALPADWAMNVICDLAELLHEAAGTEPLTWLDCSH